MACLPGIARLRVADRLKKFVPGGLAIDADGQDAVRRRPVGPCRLRPCRSTTRTSAAPSSSDKDSYPYTCLPEPGGKRLFVSLWGKAAVAVIDLESDKVAAVWPTESHPTEMALAPDGKTLYVACANSTRVSVLDAAHDGKSLQTIACCLYPTAPSGNTPNSLSLSPDGQILFVANADANNLAVFKVAKRGKAQPLGFIPTGWYPTSRALRRQGQEASTSPTARASRSRANPQGPNPHQRRELSLDEQYIAGLFRGTLEHHRHADAGADGRLQQASLRVQSAARRLRRHRRSARGQSHSRRSSARPVPSSTASTSSRRTAPTTRSSAT